MSGVVSKDCFNIILHLPAELPMFVEYYVSKFWELQLMNTGYCQTFRFDYISENLRHLSEFLSMLEGSL